MLQIERLAQYERLVGSGCGRRRAARLSDLERVQDLFPHDFLALHDADAPAALASHHQVTKGTYSTSGYSTIVDVSIDLIQLLNRIQSMCII